MGGVGVITGTSVDGGQPVSIRFDLPGDRRVNARAEVVRMRDGEMGLRFVKLDPSSLAALLSYVGAGVPAPVLDS